MSSLESFKGYFGLLCPVLNKNVFCLWLAHNSVAKCVWNGRHMIMLPGGIRFGECTVWEWNYIYIYVHPVSTRTLGESYCTWFRCLACYYSFTEDAPLVEFMYLVFTRVPGESYSRQLRFLLLYLRYVFQALIDDLRKFRGLLSVSVYRHGLYIQVQACGCSAE